MFKYTIPILAMHEAAIASCYRLLLGNKSPKTTLVYANTAKKEILAIHSEKIPGFITICTLQNISQLLQQPKFVQGLAKIFVASYLFEEDDLHKRNFGIDSAGIPCRIDFGMSFFNTVYAQTREVHVAPIITKNIWKISEQDIINFPILTEAKPWYWPTIDTVSTLGSIAIPLGKDKLFTAEDVTLFSSLAKNEDFIAAKYRCFLKLLLIPKKYFEEQFKMYLAPGTSMEVDNLRDALILHLNERRDTLRETLIQIPEFQNFLTTQKDADTIISKLTNELQLESTESNTLKEEISAQYKSILQESQSPTISDTKPNF